jgi:aerobic C4-dicarboxylate transport protein
VVFKALKWFMYLAPIGAFAGMAYTIGEYGLETLMPLGKLMLTVYITMAVFIFVILGSIMRYYKMSILAFITYIKAELLLFSFSAPHLRKAPCLTLWKNWSVWVAANQWWDW